MRYWGCVKKFYLLREIMFWRTLTQISCNWNEIRFMKRHNIYYLFKTKSVSKQKFLPRVWNIWEQSKSPWSRGRKWDRSRQFSFLQSQQRAFPSRLYQIASVSHLRQSVKESRPSLKVSSSPFFTRISLIYERSKWDVPKFPTLRDTLVIKTKNTKLRNPAKSGEQVSLIINDGDEFEIHGAKLRWLVGFNEGIICTGKYRLLKSCWAAIGANLPCRLYLRYAWTKSSAGVFL